MKQKLSLLILLMDTLSTIAAPLAADAFRIRDPFVFPNTKDQTYYLYAADGNDGVMAYRSKDLKTWQSPVRVLTIPEGIGQSAVWAPEMHEYKGKYYLFTTLTRPNAEPKPIPVVKDWMDPRQFIQRGTWIFRADSPLGPFKPMKMESITPSASMALDGTLWEEEGKPYMIFCHEWVQLIDGTMEIAQLQPDLSDLATPPKTLFHASAAPFAVPGARKGKVTDGPFLYRSPKSKKLFMIWSTFLTAPYNGYSVLYTQSETGSVQGPWKKHTILYTKNGGHGMLFKTFKGRLMLSLHQPNVSPKERMHLYEIEDTGDKLQMKGE